jgi:RNA polymerase sigma factor (sigma-70 family)
LNEDLRELVLKAREDSDAMAEVIKRFENLIKKCIKMYIKNLSDYEDAMQTGRIAVMNCVRNYDVNSPVHFAGYAKMGVIYSVRNFFKGIKWEVSLDEELVEEDGVAGSLHDLLDSGIDLEGDKIRRDDIARLREALGRLWESERNIIEDFYFKDVKMVEMSRGMRCSYPTVVRRKTIALEKLRTIMKD